MTILESRRDTNASAVAAGVASAAADTAPQLEEKEESVKSKRSGGILGRISRGMRFSSRSTVESLQSQTSEGGTLPRKGTAVSEAEQVIPESEAKSDVKSEAKSDVKSDVKSEA